MKKLLSLLLSSLLICTLFLSLSSCGYRKTFTVRMTVNVDGEVLTAETVRLRIADKKIRFFYPKGLSYKTKTPAVTG